MIVFSKNHNHIRKRKKFSKDPRPLSRITFESMFELLFFLLLALLSNGVAADVSVPMSLPKVAGVSIGSCALLALLFFFMRRHVRKNVVA